MNLNQKTVLITGSSRGLGRALAAEFARAGAKVVLVARHLIELEEATEAIRKNGGTAFAVQADVSDKKAIYPLVAQANLLSGPVDILVNNASTLGAVPLRSLADTDCEDLEAVLATNLIGPFRLTKAVLGSMLLRKQGIVLNISSDAAVAAYPGWGAYSASKAALLHLTRIWGEEIKGSGVHFLSRDPGEMNTKMHADAIPDADPKTLLDPVEVAERIVHELRNLA